MDEPLRTKANKLLAQVGFAQLDAAELLKGGRNNRVYKLSACDARLLLKEYFKHPGDPRDRCSTEFEFASFAWRQGIRSIAQPFACDGDAGLALYEFVAGDRIPAEGATPVAVSEAMDFLAELNLHNSVPDAARLRAASEACFSTQEHVDVVSRRVERLVDASQAEMFSPEARTLIRRDIVPLWERIRGNIEEPRFQSGVSAHKLLSPSDFGFHNAIRRHDTGKLCFVDFEYAGWDDVAKTICDFFLQPEVPVAGAMWQMVADRLLTADRVQQEQRVRSLFPVYKIKWATILLNDFLPTSGDRRLFSLGLNEDADRKRRQLEKAAALLAHISSSPAAGPGKQCQYLC